MSSLSRMSVASLLLSACAPAEPPSLTVRTGSERPPLAPVRLVGGSQTTTVDTWWVSGNARVEQGWTLSSGEGARQRLELDLREGAVARRAPSGLVIEEVDGRVWQVSGARAWDARGTPLPAVLAATGAGLAVEVDTGGAVWPVTVDPVYEAAAWETVGAGTYTGVGASVAAGDLNGDGYRDVVVGGYYDAGSTGRVDIFYGTATGVSTTAGTTLLGGATGDLFGWAVAVVGDLDGDGADELVVGAPGQGADVGAVYLFFGASGGVGAAGQSITGPATYTRFGAALAAVGDTNGDGGPDLLVGAYTTSSNTGAAYLYTGSTTGLSTSAAVSFSAPSAGAYFGESLAGAGDVNNDGFNDVIIGSRGTGGGAGSAQVYLGSTAGVSTTAVWSTSGAAGEYLGTGVGGAGDVNNDGFDDVIVGAIGVSSYTGEALIFHGSATGPSATASTTLSGTSAGGYFGQVVAGVGDVDGDGYADVAVAAINEGTYDGAVYVFEGGAAGVGSTAVRAIAGSLDARLGSSLVGAGDVDGSGHDDLLIGGPSQSTWTGRAQLHLGYDDTDADGDGSTADLDCDDGDDERYPGATELCDLKDNDCDGDVDEAGASGEREFFADVDGDTFGVETTTTTDCFVPAGYAEVAGDCDDGDSAVHPDAAELCDAADTDEDCDGDADDADGSATGKSTFYLDSDTDGYGDAAGDYCDLPAGYVPVAGDCNDGDAAISPNASELCDASDTDENCDGSADDADAFATGKSVFYLDTDGDGFGDTSAEFCDPAHGYTVDAGDCDDGNPAVHPAAGEVCDGADTDEDCNGVADDLDAAATGQSTFYADADDDGYGAVAAAFCDRPLGYVDVGGDCNDIDVSINPGATERCGGSDDDCDGLTDESGALGEGTWYADADADGFGDPTVPVLACAAPIGYLADASDCDDGDPAINELAAEVCDAVDNNCDGDVDESGAIGEATWYEDLDGDGHGTSGSTAVSCDAPDGYVADGGDCDDAVSAIFPGAPESDCTDPTDYNCDGSAAYADADADGAAACEDCNDAVAEIGPQATEVCNELDDDCDGSVDVDAVDAPEWYPDEDGDGYTLGDDAVLECDEPPGMSPLSSPLDCDDADGAIYPGAPEEAGDDIDQDCDGADTELEDTGTVGEDQGVDVPDADDTGAGGVQGCTHGPKPLALGWLVVLLAGLGLRRSR